MNLKLVAKATLDDSEVPVGQSLDIHVNRCAFDLHFWAADDMDFLLPDCKRLQRVVVSLSLVLSPCCLRRGRKVWESWVMVKIPLLMKLVRSFSGIPLSRLRSSFSIAFVDS